jgi:YbbR domain-containing protein
MTAQEFIRRHVWHNIGLKIVSLLFAVGLWLAVSSEPTSEVALDATIVFRNMPENLEISSENVPSAQIRVRGPERTIRRLQSSDVHAEINLNGMRPGERTFDLTADQIHVPDRIRIVQIIPSQIHLAFDLEAVREIPIHPRVVGTFATGYRVSQVTASPETVRISGPRKQVAEADDAITDPVDVSGITDRHSFSTHAYVSDPLIQVVNPRPVQVTVIMERIPVSADVGDTQPK